MTFRPVVYQGDRENRSATGPGQLAASEHLSQDLGQWRGSLANLPRPQPRQPGQCADQGWPNGHDDDSPASGTAV